MNGKQYNNVINWTLKHEQAVKTGNALEVARAIFKNMGVALPTGDMQEVFETIKTDNYMGWRACTMKEAQEGADNGVATIGINSNKIVVLAAADKDESVLETTLVMTLSENTSAYAIADLQFYANLAASTTTIYCSNSYLNQSEMTYNAQYILNYLRARGWTKNAICGMLGNMEVESTINPGLWESLDAFNMKGGFGLVQWTPAEKYINWALELDLAYLNIDTQLERILYELKFGEQYYSTSSYPLSFATFTCSTNAPDYLARAFMHNYERPNSYATESNRAAYATKWYIN